MSEDAVNREEVARLQSQLNAEKEKVLKLRAVLETRLVKRLAEIVEGWGETRHDKRLGFTGMGAKLTCGHVYELIDAVNEAQGDEVS